MQDTTTNRRFLLGPAVRERAGGLHDSTLWRMEQRGEFPKRVKVSPGRVGWLESDVDAWIAKRLEGGR
jgi:prophage regulatory protein